MAVNLRKYGKVIENVMFGDKCTITRLSETTDAYGAKKPNGRTTIYNNIACKFSFVNKDAPSDTNTSNVPKIKQVTVFISLDYNIIAGDYVSGYRKDITSGIDQPIEGMCGEPNRFDTHQEVPIQINGEN